MSDDKLIQRISDYVEYEANMTRNAFATKAGIDPTNFSKMLAGKQSITTNTLRKIAAAHGVSLTWLMSGEGDMTEAKPAIDMTRHNSDGDNAGGNIFKIVDPKTLKAEEETICALKNEVAHLKELLQERERVIAEKERFIQHLLGNK